MPSPSKATLKSRLNEETRRREDLEARLQALEASSLPGPPEGIDEASLPSSQDTSSAVLLSTVLKQQQAFQQVITTFMDKFPPSAVSSPGSSSTHPLGAAKRMDVPKLKSPSSITLAAFRDWKERFAGYVEATRLRHDCNLLARRSILRSALHDDWSQLWTGSVLAVEDTDDVDIIVSKLGDYLRKQRNPLLDRRDFHQRNQHDGESIDQYCAALRQIEESCGFSPMLDCPHCEADTGLALQLRNERIRDRLICGLRDSDTQQKVLAEPFSSLTLEKTLTLCTAQESSKATQNKLLSAPTLNVVAPKFPRKSTATKQKHTPASAQKPHCCPFCGKSPFHPRLECPARESQCAFCGITGHWQVACHKKAKTKQQKQTPKGQTQNHIYVAAVASSATTVQLSTSTPMGTSPLPWLPDSGAACDVLGRRNLAEINPDLEHNLFISSEQLYTADKSPLPTLGCCPMTISLADKVYTSHVYIVEQVNAPLLSKAGCIALGLLPPDWPHVTSIDRVSLLKSTDPEATQPPPSAPTDLGSLNIPSLVAAFPKAFQEDGPLLTMDGPPMSIQLVDNVTPVRRYKAYNVPFHWQQPVQDQLASMVVKDVIEKVPLGESPEWIHPMVVVPKKNSTEPRITVDLTALNRYVKRPGYPAKVPRELVAQIPPGMTYFTTLDARHGYWQVPLAEESRPLTTFITPWGCYRFKRNVMGLVSAGDEHNRRGDEAIAGIDNVKKIVEDIIIYDDNLADHVRRVRSVIARFAEHGITLTRKKLVLAAPLVEWCGYSISQDGYTVSSSLVEALTKFPTPKSLTDLRSFCGLVQQFEAFSADIASLSEPLRALLSPKQPFVWEGPQQLAFEQLISTLTSPRVLTHFDPGAKLRLETDAAQSKGLGFALCSEQSDGSWKLLQCGSRFVTDAESRYSATEIELCAVVWAIRKCNLFLRGTPFTLVVDHKPLVSILNQKSLGDPDTARIIRLKEKLSGYMLTATWRQGIRHTVVDCFSRFPVAQPDASDLEDDSDISTFLAIAHVPLAGPALSSPSLSEDATIARVRSAAHVDPLYRQLHSLASTGFPDHKAQLDLVFHPFWQLRHELSVLDSHVVLYRDRLVIPSALRADILGELHAAHLGRDRTLARARQCVFWPGISNDVTNMVRQCTACAEHLPSLAKEPLLQDTPPTRPGEAIACDLFSHAGHEFLVITDKFSGWPMVVNCGHSADTDDVVEILLSWFCTMGVPVRLTSDGGPQFASRQFAAFCLDWGTFHDPSSPYHHIANGYAEAAVKAVKRIVSKTTVNGNLSAPDFYKAILEYRNTPRSDGLSPALRLYGKPMRTRIPLNPAQFAPDIKALFDAADMKATTLKAKAKQRYDQHAVVHDPLTIGDLVRIQDPRTHRWLKIAEVLSIEPRARSYRVKSESGRIYWRNRRFLRRYYGPQSTSGHPSTDTDAGPDAAPVDQRRSSRTRRPPTRLDL